MNPRTTKLLAGLTAGVLLLLASSAEARLLWRVRDPSRPDATLHVLASVSLADEDRLRFDASVIEAFAGSRRLVLPNNAALSKQNALIGWKAHLAEGDNLVHWLGDEMMAEYVEAVGRAGFPPTFADVTAPWFAARMVRLADWTRTGYLPEREFETWFAHVAAERAEPIEIFPLEESAASYDRAAALSREIQREIMRRALIDSERAQDALPAAARAWKAGSAKALAKALGETDRLHPELDPSRKLTVLRENTRITRGVTKLLGEPGKHDDFLLADARNLLGQGGVLEQLRGAGLEVEAVAARPGTESPYPAPPVPAPPAAEAPEAPEAKSGRVLLVGIDGASLRVIAPLIEAGRLPVLAGLARDGASGTLRSHRPIYSPRIWNSIASGKTPEKHGVEGFTFVDPAGVQRLYLSSHRKAHALWNIATTAGLRVGVVNWWNTYPPEVVNGVMVSDHAKPTRLGELRKLTGAEAAETEGATVFPASWQERVSRLYAERPTLPGLEDPFLGNLGLAAWMQKEELSKRFRDDAAAARIALEVEAETRPQLMMIFLAGIDRVSHRLWASIEPATRYDKPPAMNPRQRAAAREALELYYEYSDALIGLLSRGYGKDDLVMVVSDHGFEAGEHLGDLTGVHEGEPAIDGVLFARGPGITPGSRTEGTSVNDITPTILAWLGLPVGRDMDGRVAAILRTPDGGVGKIATHDTTQIQRVGTAPSGSEEQILDQLRALGYIE
jgi:uncharacterized protein YbaP (TraB family)